MRPPFDRPQERSAVSHSPPTQHPPVRILLVEDSVDDAELVSHALTRAGLEFSMECVDTERAYERALLDAPQLILCDFHLPGFSCRKAFEIVAERRAGTPFIVVSRYIGDHEVTDLMQAGASAFVRKDRLSELAAAITAALAPTAAGQTQDPPAG